MNDKELTEKQDEAVRSEARFTLVTASAGTGKTRVLVNRFLHILEKEQPPLDQIVALTFTRNAAAEMKYKIRSAVEKKLTDSPSDKKYWESTFRKIDTARVSTFHSFYADLLRKHAFDVGIDPEFSIIEDNLDPDKFLDDMFILLVSKMQSEKSEALSYLTNFFDLRQIRDNVLKPIYMNREKLHRIYQFKEIDPASLPLNSGSLNNIQDEIKQTVKDQNSRSHDEMRTILSKLISVYIKFEKLIANHRNDSSQLDFTDIELRARKLLFHNTEILSTIRSNLKHLLIDEFQDTNLIQLDIISALVALEDKRIDDNQPLPSLFIVGDEKQSIYRFRGADVTVFSKFEEIIKTHPPSAYKTITLDKNFRSSGDIVRFHNYFFPTFMAKERVAGYESPYQNTESHHPTKESKCVNLFFHKAGKEEETGSRAQSTESSLDHAEGKKLNMEQLRTLEARHIAEQILRIVKKEKLEVREEHGTRHAGFGDITLLFNALTNFDIYEKEFSRYSIPYRTAKTQTYFEQPEIYDIISILSAVDSPFDNYNLAAALRSPIFGINDKTLFHLLSGQACPLWETIPQLESMRNIEHRQKKLLSKAATTLAKLNSLKDIVSLPDFVALCLNETELETVYAGVENGKERVGNIEYFIGELVPQIMKNGAESFSQFVYEINELSKGDPKLDRKNSSRDANDSILVSTIHQAKGLEYPIVFIPNLAQGSKSQSDLIINSDLGMAVRYKTVDNDSHKIEVIESRSFTALKQEEKRLETAEKRRLMYVAATRARDYLFFYAFGSQRKDRPFLQMMQEFMPDGKFYNEPPEDLKRILTVVDCSENGGKINDKISLASTTSVSKKIIDENTINRIKPIPLMLAGKERFFPSELPDYVACPKLYYLRYIKGIAEPQVKGSDSNRPISGKDFGSLVHRAIAMYKGDDPPETFYSIYELPETEDKKGNLASEVSKLVRNFRECEIFSAANKSDQIHYEYKFLFNMEGNLFDGAIDLLFSEEGTPHLVDFKTDLISSEKVEKLCEHYRPQLDIYALATAETLKVDKIKYSILFLRLPKVRSITLSKNDLAEIREKAKHLIKKMKTDSEWKPNPTNCERCPYKGLCDVYQI